MHEMLAHVERYGRRASRRNSPRFLSLSVIIAASVSCPPVWGGGSAHPVAARTARSADAPGRCARRRTSQGNVLKDKLRTSFLRKGHLYREPTGRVKPTTGDSPPLESGSP